MAFLFLQSKIRVHHSLQNPLSRELGSGAIKFSVVSRQQFEYRKSKAFCRGVARIVIQVLTAVYNRTYNDARGLEWDPAKARANLRKHGVRFADAVTALEDARAVSVRDDVGDEERWVSIGMDSLGHILVVVYTWRDERVRLISARPATRKEARQYEEGI